MAAWGYPAPGEMSGPNPVPQLLLWPITTLASAFEPAETRIPVFVYAKAAD